MLNPHIKVVIIGAGPAGLTAAYQLCKAKVRSLILEKDCVVGGISRTVNYKGYHFDIGGHRFFTKVKAVDAMWHEVLAEGQFLRRNRLSRIFYNKTFFNYPLVASNALMGLGVWNSALIFLSYLRAQLFPEKPEDTFEQWISNRFGKRLYRIFFKTYTEKVWGMPCNQIMAEWAAQRIKGLSLLAAVKSALVKRPQSKGDVIKTLIDAFDYPELGPGMMWETVKQIVERDGSELQLNTGVEKIFWSKGRVDALEVMVDGKLERIEGTHFISTMPIRELIQKFDPPVPDTVLKAAEALNYRDFLTVALIIKQPELFPDNWIYIHDPSVKVGRVQNFRSWSPEMVPDPDKACYGLEYFCFEHDGLWDSSDADLIELAKKELMQIGLAQEGDVMDGCVVRQKKAYPVYDDDYAKHVATVRNEIEERYPNLHLVGRNGMHKYNNQDHAMMTAMLCVENILADTKLYDLWQVNGDAEYHEAGEAAPEHEHGSAIRLVPMRAAATGLSPEQAG